MHFLHANIHSVIAFDHTLIALWCVYGKTIAFLSNVHRMADGIVLRMKKKVCWKTTSWYCPSKWGFPVSQAEVCHRVQSYLNVSGACMADFHDNLPGKKWVSAYLNRHPHLANRSCTKRSKMRTICCHSTSYVPTVHQRRGNSHSQTKMTLSGLSQKTWCVDSWPRPSPLDVVVRFWYPALFRIKLTTLSTNSSVPRQLIQPYGRLFVPIKPLFCCILSSVCYIMLPIKGSMAHEVSL